MDSVKPKQDLVATFELFKTYLDLKILFMFCLDSISVIVYLWKEVFFNKEHSS
jgi:hypothetical protein